MEEGNSIRDTLKDRFRVLLALKLSHDEAYEMSCDLADVAGEVFGASPEMQDKPEELPDKIKCFVEALIVRVVAPEKVMSMCDLSAEELEAFTNR